jgi:TonB-linked SusC/RagA family outer membrane protein
MLKLLNRLILLSRPPVIALSLLLVALIAVNAYAQITVKGTITDSDSYTGLPGVNVVIQGTATGTITDIDGNYAIEVPNGEAVLVFSSVGYSTFETRVGSRTVIDVPMIAETTALDEIVVVGYGTQQKVTVTGAVVDVKGKELVKSPAVDMTNSLAGRMAGVQVIQSGAEPGLDGAEIRIRGANTMGDTRPLVVIDGIPDRDGGFGRLNPQDIESISVLKDASAAIYGARAANGAILVTTKRGTSGKPTVNFDFNQGWAQPTVLPELANAVDFGNMVNEVPIYKSIPVGEWGAAWESIQNTGVYQSPTAGITDLSATYSPEDMDGFRSGSDPWLYPNTDWFGDTFQKWAPQSRFDVQLTGGAKRVRYFASVGYLDQDSYYANSATFYKQYSARINLDADISDWFKISIGLLGRREDRNFATQGRGAIFRMIMRGRPTEPAIWPSGDPGPDIENGQNPVVVTTNLSGYDRQPTDYFQSNGKLIITQPWVEGLELELSGAVDYRSGTRKLWEVPWELYYLAEPLNQNPDGSYDLISSVRSNYSDARLRQTFENVLNTNLTARLSYDRTFGDHRINAMIGVQKEQFEGSNFSAFRRNYISTAVDQLFAGGAVAQNTDGGAYERARLGYFGRAQYDFRQKYLVEFIFRYDGSYIFPEDKRFGFFPGILAGWNMSNENWFDVGWIDYLKVRASYGTMGNDVVVFGGQLQEYAFLSTYSFGQYPINSVVQTTLQETLLANPNFTWEVAKNFNVGLDATFFNNSLDMTLEYFYNKRDDILIQETGSTPASSGIADLLPPVNGGRVDNRGFEFSFLYSNNKSAVRWNAGINAGYAKNEVVFMDEIPGAPPYQLQEGKPIGAYLVYQYDGVFRDEEAVASNTLDYSEITNELVPGDMKFQDVNNDGVINGDDQVMQEKSIDPTWTYGATFNLTWKGFDFSLLFQGAAGHQLRIYRNEVGFMGNYLQYTVDNRWSIDNPSDVHPRIFSRGDTYYSGGGYGNNSYWLQSKNYLRLKNLEIGYSIPMGKQNVVQRFRVYLRGFNVATIAAQNIYDPETEDQSGQNYPQARIISLGGSITF